MSDNTIQNLDAILATLSGRMAWSARRGYGTFLTMEFGSPHIKTREPINVSPEADPEHSARMARRRVFIEGDWHFWIQHANWTLRTASHLATNTQSYSAMIDQAMQELDGQILESYDISGFPEKFSLRFDLGAMLDIGGSDRTGDELWSITLRNEYVVICDAAGNLTREIL